MAVSLQKVAIIFKAKVLCQRNAKFGQNSDKLSSRALNSFNRWICHAPEGNSHWGHMATRLQSFTKTTNKASSSP